MLSTPRGPTINTLFFAIVQRGRGSIVLHKAESIGAAGGTIFHGEGTKRSKLFHTLRAAQSHKEIVMISADDQLCAKLHDTIFQEFKMYKRGRGIAFSIPFKQYKPDLTEQQLQSHPKNNYSCILVIIDRGRSEECINVARKAGVRGGTVVHARGAGIPADFYFPLFIEPQKDLVIILTQKEQTQATIKKLVTELGLEQPGVGILFELPVIRTSGLFENRGTERAGGAS